MTLNKDFREFIASLNENDVKHLIVGGYAVNLNGYPRYTKDIDCWIEPSEDNIKRLLSAINDFGFGSLNLDEQDFVSPDNIIQLGRAPYRIDLLTDIDGIDFNECYQRKNRINIDNTEINFLGIEDLITAKKESGRLQDLADAEELEKIKEGEDAG